jgi:adenylate cyclase
MGADEVGTLTALKRLRREIVNPAITEHNGRIKSRIRECAE